MISTEVGNVVHKARELGWTPQERNKTARKHFYFDGPVLFSVIAGSTSLFTIGNMTTSWEKRAIELLEAAARKVA